MKKILKRVLVASLVFSAVISVETKAAVFDSITVGISAVIKQLVTSKKIVGGVLFCSGLALLVFFVEKYRDEKTGEDLVKAIMFGDKDGVEKILGSRKININASVSIPVGILWDFGLFVISKTTLNGVPLTYAVQERNLGIIKLLLSRGAKIDKTVLEEAERQKNLAEKEKEKFIEAQKELYRIEIINWNLDDRKGPKPELVELPEEELQAT